MKLGDYIKATSNGGWTRAFGIFIKEYETEIALDVSDEIRFFKKNLFTFEITDVNGRVIG